MAKTKKSENTKNTKKAKKPKKLKNAKIIDDILVCPKCETQNNTNCLYIYVDEKTDKVNSKHICLDCDIKFLVPVDLLNQAFEKSAQKSIEEKELEE